MFFTQAVRDTFPEHYPDAVRDLMPEMVSIKLTSDDALILGGFNQSFRAAMSGVSFSGYFSTGFLDALDATMAQFPEGVMPRIGYCSWKAGSLRNAPALGAHGVLQTMSCDDPRIGKAMVAHAVMNEPVVLHLRPWIKIQDWAEFRLFIRDGRVVGASQYLHRETFPAITHNEAAILSALQSFSMVLLEALHLPSVVADVFVESKGTGFRATLIELNPFTPETDACLFSWAKGGDFDGSFRFHRVQVASAARMATLQPGGGDASGNADYWITGI